MYSNKTNAVSLGEQMLLDSLDSIGDSLQQIFSTDEKKISDGSTRIPYQEFTITLAAGARDRIFQVFDYLRIMTASAGGLSIKLGQNGVETPFTGAGVGINLNYVYDRIELINTSGVSITLTIALALGTVDDNRLTVSTPIQVDQSNSFTTAQTSIGTTAVQLVTAASTNGDITISAGIADLYIGNSSGVTTATGFLIPAGSSYTFSKGFVGAVWGIRAVAAQTAYELIESY